jgi:hypothetical protein
MGRPVGEVAVALAAWMVIAAPMRMIYDEVV